MKFANKTSQLKVKCCSFLDGHQYPPVKNNKTITMEI